LIQTQNSSTEDDEGISGAGFGFNNDNPGSFLPATAATPLPSTWMLLIAGFVGLGFFAYRGAKTNPAALAAA
jgi:hypothetical protein